MCVFEKTEKKIHFAVIFNKPLNCWAVILFRLIFTSLVAVFVIGKKS